VIPICLFWTEEAQTVQAVTTAVGYSPSRIVDLYVPDDAEASRRIEAAAKLAGLAALEWMHVLVLADDPMAPSEVAAASTSGARGRWHGGASIVKGNGHALVSVES